MGNLLSKKDKKKKDQVSDADKAVLELKVQRDNLHKHKRKVEAVMAREKEIAAALLKEGKKEKALLALKKRKMQGKLIEKTDEQMLRMEEMVSGVEAAQREKMVFEAMRVGTDALKEMQKETSLEAVEQLMQDTQEAMDYQKEVEALLAGQITDVDEAAMESELDAMAAAMGMATTPTANTTAADISNAPDVPATDPKLAPITGQQEAQKEEEEEEDEDMMPPPEMAPA
eukprot:CAMPEP_0196726882 /NCGR_PEP_ID=MMETSP1091-20130531/8005_1 /TAXON_ID=302021 /ORGANISM="Rhodomonas sp., Strain CCMP768" /LENGTH=228 /DNA_ID=CAMNT_0042069375 /DNA_START=146 /DNA_END=832 /DNA_ORIENTATION=-